MDAPSFAERALDELGRALADRYAPPPSAARPENAHELCRAALASPIGSDPLVELARSAEQIAVLVNDASRDEPREALLAAIREAVPWEKVTLFVASGTHVADASVVPAPFRDAAIVVHDATRLESMVDLGRTARGTRVRINAEVAAADLIVLTGRLRPHYFAGFSGGLKSSFPGVGFADDILDNHRLKADPSARLGRIDDNLCRLDMEEAARKLEHPQFLLNLVADIDGRPVAARAGDPVAAHRALVGAARPLFTVRAPRARVVVVADRAPVSSSLYQASKLIPPAAALLEDGGVVIVVADCREGTGPLERVNRGIYELGLQPQLPARHRILLVSELAPELVRKTYAEPAASLEAALETAYQTTGADRAVVLWRAAESIAEPA
jgi:nickel-dependent lactate racemase